MLISYLSLIVLGVLVLSLEINCKFYTKGSIHSETNPGMEFAFPTCVLGDLWQVTWIGYIFSRPVSASLIGY